MIVGSEQQRDKQAVYLTASNFFTASAVGGSGTASTAAWRRGLLGEEEEVEEEEEEGGTHFGPLVVAAAAAEAEGTDTFGVTSVTAAAVNSDVWRGAEDGDGPAGAEGRPRYVPLLHAAVGSGRLAVGGLGTITGFLTLGFESAAAGGAAGEVTAAGAIDAALGVGAAPDGPDETPSCTYGGCKRKHGEPEQELDETRGKTS